MILETLAILFVRNLLLQGARQQSVRLRVLSWLVIVSDESFVTVEGPLTAEGRVLYLARA